MGTWQDAVLQFTSPPPVVTTRARSTRPICSVVLTADLAVLAVRTTEQMGLVDLALVVTTGGGDVNCSTASCHVPIIVRLVSAKQAISVYITAPMEESVRRILNSNQPSTAGLGPRTSD